MLILLSCIIAPNDGLKNKSNQTNIPENINLDFKLPNKPNKSNRSNSDHNIVDLYNNIYVSESPRYLKFVNIGKIIENRQVNILTINTYSDAKISIIDNTTSTQIININNSTEHINIESANEIFLYDINHDNVNEILSINPYYNMDSSMTSISILEYEENRQSFDKSLQITIVTRSMRSNISAAPMITTTVFDMTNDEENDIVIGSNSVYILSEFTNQNTLASPILFTLSPEIGRDNLGVSLDHADINADGTQDLLIASELGAAYVVSGPVTASLSMTEADFSLKTNNPRQPIRTKDIDHADLNNDGYDDFIIGDGEMLGTDYNGGGVYILLGPLIGERMTDDADAIWVGRSLYSHAGEQLCTGDVNADGISDLLIGAWSDGSDIRQTGHVTSITEFIPGISVLEDIGTTLWGEELDDRFGFDCTIADLDDNGFNDILINAPGNTTHGGGAIYRINDGLP